MRGCDWLLSFSRLGILTGVCFLPVLEAVLGRFLKSQVCLDWCSRHFKKHYCKLTDDTVSYCNYQSITDVSCLRVLIGVYDCFTVLQLNLYSHITKQPLQKPGWKKKSFYLLTTAWDRNAFKSEFCSKWKYVYGSGLGCIVPYAKKTLPMMTTFDYSSIPKWVWFRTMWNMINTKSTKTN